MLAASNAIADSAISVQEQALLAGACAGCHSATQTTGAIPALMGQSFQQLEQSLLAFRDGSRDSTLMMRITKGYSVTELQALARYFAAAPTIAPATAESD
ncbi:MAG: cytochrome c [Pseudomonadales bacterium]